jgi:hypothetical protein
LNPHRIAVEEIVQMKLSRNLRKRLKHVEFAANVLKLRGYEYKPHSGVVALVKVLCPELVVNRQTAYGFLGRFHEAHKFKYDFARVDLQNILFGERDVTDDFYRSAEWLCLREEAFRKYGRRCGCCGVVQKLHVDHVKPKSKYPELVLDIKNLQILCLRCNSCKGNWDETDYRVVGVGI